VAARAWTHAGGVGIGGVLDAFEVQIIGARAAILASLAASGAGEANPGVGERCGLSGIVGLGPLRPDSGPACAPLGNLLDLG
jgi:hypothetical protein